MEELCKKAASAHECLLRAAEPILRYGNADQAQSMRFEEEAPVTQRCSTFRLCLAVKSGMSVAVVVGINCFLPKFSAAFGAYLICFKMEPTTFGERQCLVGANPLVSMTMACSAIMVCFGVGPGSWIKMTRDKSLSDKPQVLFLTRSYRKGFETWEVERLLRRMLLKIVGTALPITLNPSAQMAFVTFVLVASLFLHATQAPYAKDTWNHIEQGLLVTALLIVTMTTLCLANEAHWARSEAQIMLILVITSIIAITGLKKFHRSDESFFLLIPEVRIFQNGNPYVCGLYLHEIGR